MDKRIILITGAAGNLGRAVSRKFLDLACHIHATLGPHDDPDFISSPDLVAKPVNLLDEEESTAFVNETYQEHGRVDMAVLTVGGFAMGNIMEVTMGDINKMISLNFNTAFFIIKPLLKIFEKQGYGQLILIGARPGLDAREGKNFVAYGLTKSMLTYLSETINAQFEGKPITSTVIAPSTIDTPGARKGNPEADFSKWVTPEDIAETIAFVNSKAGKQLRHSSLHVYGLS